MMRRAHVAVIVLLAAGLYGCGRGEADSDAALLIYCTPPAAPYARVLVAPPDPAAGNPLATLAPMKGADLTAAVTRLAAGDLVVCLGDALPERLRQANLVATEEIIGWLEVVLLARPGLTLDQLGEPGMRLGAGKAGGALEQAANERLDKARRERLETRIVHRSENSRELLRLLQLGALDAAFVWQGASVPEGLGEIPLDAAGDRTGTCPLRLLALRCSRQPATRLDTVCAAWRSPAARVLLADLGVKPQLPTGEPEA